MAEFKSSAREGNFNNNQLSSPSEVEKFEKEAARKSQGMSIAQAQLEKNRGIFLQAQKEAQALEQDSKSDALKAQQEATRMQRDAATKRWEFELAENERKSAERTSTYSQLAAFSKTAFTVGSQIVKQNKENQLKAINQIQFNNNFSWEDIVAASQIDQSMSRAEYMRTIAVQESIAEGKSQEFHNAFYDHLVKGGGYRNYIHHKAILGQKGRTNANAILLLSANKDLSIEERTKQRAALEAEQRAGLTVNGEQVRAEFLETSGYNQSIRSALNKSDELLNGAKLAELEETNKRDRAILYHTLLFSGDGFNPGAVFQKVSENPTPNGLTEAVTIMVTGNNLTTDQIAEIRNARFEKNGKMITLQEGGYTDALVMLNSEYSAAKQLTKEKRELEQQQQDLEQQQWWLEKTQAAVEDQKLTKKELRAISNEADEKFGRLRSKEMDERLANETVSAQLRPLIEEDLERRALDGSLTRAYMMEQGIPIDLQNRYNQYADKIQGIKASPEYKAIGEAIEQRVKGAMVGTTKFQTGIDGKLQSDEAQWYLADQTKIYRKKYFDAMIAGATPVELNSILDQAANETRLYLDSEENYMPGVGIAKYNKYMDESLKDQLKVQQKITALEKVFGNAWQRENPKEIIKAIGEAPLIDAAEELRTTGESILLQKIASKLKKTPIEFINELAEVNDNIQPIVVPANYQQMLDNWTPEIRFSLTSELTTNKQSLRDTRKALKDLSPMPTRSTVQIGDEVGSFPVEGISGDFSEADSYGLGWGGLSRVIRFAEGTASNAGYNTMFTHKQFDGYGDHPRQLQSSGRWTSDAAGAYQFLSTTWDGARSALGLQDFSPASQEAGARHLTQHKRGVNPDKVIKTIDEFREVMDQLAPEWASLPYSKPSPKGFGNGSSYYGQGGKSLETLWEIYQQYTANQ